MAIEMGTKNREVSSAVLLSGAEAELVKKGTGELSLFLSSQDVQLAETFRILIRFNDTKLDTMVFFKIFPFFTDTIDDEEYIEEDSTEDSQEDIKSNKTGV